MTRIRKPGEATVQQRINGGAVKLSTFIPLQIRKRGVRKVVIRPDGESTGSATRGLFDSPVLVALAIIQAILAGQQPRCMSLIWCQRNPLPLDWIEQRRVVDAFAS